MESRSMVERLSDYMRAAYPALAIETHEETRAQNDVMAAAALAGDSPKGLLTWSVTEGVRVIRPAVREVAGTEDLQAALAVREKNCVYIFRDSQTFPFDRDPALQRGLRDLLMWAPSEGSVIVLLGAKAPMPATCEKLITVLEYGLPSEVELGRVAEAIAASADGGEVSGAVLRAVSGLSTSEAENALYLSLVETRASGRRFDPAILYREKVSAVKRSGLLELIEPDPRGLDAIGGLDVLKAWVLKRKRAFSAEAAAFGLAAPRGIEIVGVPGSGKSLAARCIGTALECPTVKLDVGSMFNSLVGESERRMREALSLAEAIAPCCLWLDEIDKGLAGSGGAGDGDSGVTKRVLGTVLTWMQERKRPVFVIATANNVTGLPPELLRKGRWDELFAVDLPSAVERAAIFGIHLAARGRSSAELGFRGERGFAVIDATEGFTGAEIEAVVNEGLYAAFDAGRELVTEDLLEAARATVPLSRTAAEQVQAIRDWAKGRARFASSSSAPTVATTGATVLRKLA